jgi:hypothetical protein
MGETLKGIRELQKIERAYGHDEPKRCIACRRYFRAKPKSLALGVSEK